MLAVILSSEFSSWSIVTSSNKVFLGKITGSKATSLSNTNLLFDVEVVDIISADQANAEAEAQRKIMEAMQKAQSSPPANK